MATATITSKGQITLPKTIRTHLRLKAGDRVVFRVREDGSIVVEAATVDLLELRGSVRPRIGGVTLEAMTAAIRRGATKSEP